MGDNDEDVQCLFKSCTFRIKRVMICLFLSFVIKITLFMKFTQHQNTPNTNKEKNQAKEQKFADFAYISRARKEIIKKKKEKKTQ